MAAATRLGTDGLAAEPASVLPAAAVELLCERGEVPADAVSVCLLTSSLVKTPDLLPEVSSRRPWRLSTDGVELDELLDRSGLDAAGQEQG